MQKLTKTAPRGLRTWMVTLLAVVFLAFPGCVLPNDFWVNIGSSGSVTATNSFVSALVNNFTQDLFGATGSDDSGTGGGETEEEGEHDDGDEH